MIISVCLICWLAYCLWSSRLWRPKSTVLWPLASFWNTEFIVGLFKYSLKNLFLPDIPIKFLMLLIDPYVDVWIFFYIKYSSSLPFKFLSWCLTACLPRLQHTVSFRFWIEVLFSTFLCTCSNALIRSPCAFTRVVRMSNAQHAGIPSQPSTQRLGEADFCEFELSLVWIASSRPVMAT